MFALSESDREGFATKPVMVPSLIAATSPAASANSVPSPPQERLTLPDSVTWPRQENEIVGFT